MRRSRDISAAGGIRGVSLALEAGGTSRRMGGDKAFLPFAGRTMLEWVRDGSAPYFPHSFVVANEPSRYRSLGLPVVTDAVLGAGAAGGIYSAVLAAPTGRVLCLGCDIPFVPPALLRELAGSASGHDVVVPRHGGYLQPLCAVYGQGALPALERLLERGERRIQNIFPEVDVKYLDVGDGRFGDPEMVFMNVNTPEDLARAEELLEAGWGGERARLPRTMRFPPAPRVRDFRRRVEVAVVSFVGKKKSGKTTVLEGVIEELLTRGVRLAAIKHDTHEFDIDVPGTDSYRLWETGAQVAGISSPQKYVYVNRVERERTLEELAAMIPEPVDIILTEGFKRQAAPKIEVSRAERSTGLVTEEEELLALVADHEGPGTNVPRLDMDDYAGIADLLMDFALGHTSDAKAGGP